MVTQSLKTGDRINDLIGRQSEGSTPIRIGEPGESVRFKESANNQVANDPPGITLVRETPFMHSSAILGRTFRLSNGDEQEVIDDYDVANLDSSPISRDPEDIPYIRALGQAHHAFTRNVQRLLPATRAIVGSLALRSQIVITSMTLGIESDPEEDIDKVVLHIRCEATPAQTFAFWDSLGLDLQAWLDRLPPREASVFLDELGLRVYWSPPLQQP